MCRFLLCGLWDEVFVENGDPRFPGNNMHGAVSGQGSPMRKPCTSLRFLAGYPCECVSVCVGVWVGVGVCVGRVLAEGICSTVKYFDTCMKK